MSFDQPECCPHVSHIGNVWGFILKENYIIVIEVFLTS